MNPLSKSRQRAPRRLRNRQRRRARELLDQAYQDNPEQGERGELQLNYESDSTVELELYLEHTRTHSSAQKSSSSPSTPPILADPSYSPVSARSSYSPELPSLPPSPPPILIDLSLSPVSSPEDNRPLSPTDSTSSVEFVEEVQHEPPSLLPLK